MVSTHSLLNDIFELQKASIIRTNLLFIAKRVIQEVRLSLGNLRRLVGTNIAGMKFLHRSIEDARKSFLENDEAIAEVTTTKKRKAKKSKRKFIEV